MACTRLRLAHICKKRRNSVINNVSIIVGRGIKLEIHENQWKNFNMAGTWVHHIVFSIGHIYTHYAISHYREVYSKFVEKKCQYFKTLAYDCSWLFSDRENTILNIKQLKNQAELLLSAACTKIVSENLMRSANLTRCLWHVSLPRRGRH